MLEQIDHRGKRFTIGGEDGIDDVARDRYQRAEMLERQTQRERSVSSSNASKNIGLQCFRRRQNADDGGAPVDVRLNRGTLNVSGEYDLPAADAA